jgi:hypothetical protein
MFSFQCCEIFIEYQPSQNRTGFSSFAIYKGVKADIRFLTLKELGVQQIHSGLETIYHKEALTLPTVYKLSAGFRVGRKRLRDDPRSNKQRKCDLATGISAMLEERPSLSDKLVARHFTVAKTTRLRILREDLGLQKFHL